MTAPLIDLRAGDILTKQSKHVWNEATESWEPGVGTALYRATCGCGWQGAAWYSSQDRAMGHFDRHECAAEIKAKP